MVRRVCHVISLASTRKLRKLFLIGQESFAHAIGPSCYITFYPFALSHWGQMDNAIVICLHIFVASQQTFPFIEVMQISIFTGIYEDSSEALLMIPQVHGYHI